MTKQSRLLMLIAPTMLVLVALVTALFQLTAPSLRPEINQRPLEFPVLHAGDPCPTSKGSLEIVPSESYVFGAGGLWFGGGPVYFSISWHDDKGEDAVFSLDPVPYVDGAYSAKTPWVSNPSYTGPILIRGQQLDGDGQGQNKLRFMHEQYGPDDNLKLGGDGSPGSSLWAFWPTSMLIPDPGCYGVQIDTWVGSGVVIFRATRATGSVLATGIAPIGPPHTP